MPNTDWVRLTPLDGRANPCVCCPPIQATLDLDSIVAVGFGRAVVMCDGGVFLDGEELYRSGAEMPAAYAEAWAALDPDHDWRVVLHAPMHGETYQRQDGAWLLVEKIEGFA